MGMELGEVQEAFANLIWEHEPIRSGELLKLCEKEFNWKSQQLILCSENYVRRAYFKMKMAL